MDVKSLSEFRGFVERITFPVAMFLYLLWFLVKLHEYTYKLGLKLVTLTAFLLTLIWVVYVWRSKQPSTTEPSTFLPRFGTKVRIASIFLVVLAALPVLWSFRPVPTFSIPELMIKLVNESTSDVAIYYMGEFFLTVPQTPATDTQVASGRIQLHRTEGSVDDQKLVVPAQGELVLFAEFLNPSEYRTFLKAGKTILRIVIFQSDGKMLTKAGIAFIKQMLAERYIVLDTR